MSEVTRDKMNEINEMKILRTRSTENRSMQRVQQATENMNEREEKSLKL